MSQNTLTAAQQKVLNDLKDVEPGLKKGQLRKKDGGDILLGDLVQAALQGNPVVINSVLTAYAANAQGTVVPVAAADSILLGLEKLDGNKPDYTEATFSATFDHSVGAKTVVVRKIGKHTALEIPAGALADGLGTVVASGATDIPAAYRPATTLTASVVVIDNGATRKAGQVVISSAGQITFSVLGTGFTNAQAAGWDRCCVTFCN
jgi:hypothetical protein